MLGTGKGERQFEVGELIGHRCWRYERKEGLLRSMNSEIWPRDNGTISVPEKQKMVQTGTSQPVQFSLNGSAGIYSWRKRGWKFISYVTEAAYPIMAVGTVWHWGNVFEHPHGWRSEHAQIRSVDWLYCYDMSIFSFREKWKIYCEIRENYKFLDTK